MLRKTIIAIIVILATLVVGYTLLGLGKHYVRKHTPQVVAIEKPVPNRSNDLPPKMSAPPPPVKVEPSSIGFSFAGLEAHINEQTPWESLFKLMFAVVGTYLGIRLTNKYVK